MLPTGTASPRSLYCDHTIGALMRWMFHSIVWMPALGAGLPSMTWPAQLGTTRDTSGRAATAANVVAPDVILMALIIQNELYRAPRALSRPRRPAWLEFATE